MRVYVPVVPLARIHHEYSASTRACNFSVVQSLSDYLQKASAPGFGLLFNIKDRSDAADCFATWVTNYLSFIAILPAFLFSLKWVLQCFSEISEKSMLEPTTERDTEKSPWSVLDPTEGSPGRADCSGHAATPSLRNCHASAVVCPHLRPVPARRPLPRAQQNQQSLPLV